ncbi:MAG: right-handed parallel beta-helix repeat-containing protein, partial [Candidatus Woesearchaeota archaeon]
MQFNSKYINYVNKSIKVIFIFLIGILFAFNVYSTTYYVDSNKGSDSNNGLSINSAFKTIDYAASKLNNNDILYIMNGTYYLDSKIRYEFKNFGNTIISGYPNHKPTIKQNIHQFENPSSGTWIKSNEAGNIWYTVYDSPNNMFIAQYSDTKTSLLTYESFTEFKNLNKPDGIYYDSASNKLYIKFKDTSKNPNNIRLIISKEIAFELYDVDGLTIANLSIIGATRCINVDASSNINIEGITCLGSFFGISVKTSRNVKINKNTAYMKRDPSFTYYDMKNRPYETTGIFLQDNYEGIVVKNNKVYGHFNGILVYSTSKGKHSNIDVSYNTIYDIYDDGLEIEDYCNGGKFHNNDIKDTFVGVSLSPADASEKRCFLTDNLIIPNKAIKWDSSGAIYEGECYKIISPGLMQNWNVSKSTCIGRGVYSIEYESSPQRNNIWENNIFYSTDQKLILKSGLSGNGVYYNNNLYYRTDGGVIFQYWNSDSNNREFFSLSDA